MPVMTLTAGALFSSCIREAAKNAEADILSCTVDGVELPQTPVITNDRISFYVNTKDMEKVKSLAPEFTLAEGATIDPASGTVRDFTTPQQYTVTSEDGQWTKSYLTLGQERLAISLTSCMNLGRMPTPFSGVQAIRGS